MLNDFIDRVMTYLRYLPKSSRKAIVCDYMEENGLISYEDLGLKCEIKKEECFCKRCIVR